jgi:hypothetical protein
MLTMYIYKQIEHGGDNLGVISLHFEFVFWSMKLSLPDIVIAAGIGCFVALPLVLGPHTLP